MKSKINPVSNANLVRTYPHLVQGVVTGDIYLVTSEGRGVCLNDGQIGSLSEYEPALFTYVEGHLIFSSD